MAQILTQSEIESVLAGLDLDSKSAQPAKKVSDADPALKMSAYDFEHPEPLRRSQLDALRLAAASASQVLKSSLTRQMMTTFDVTFLGVEQSTYRDYLATSESPSCIAVCEPADGDDVWLLDLSLCLAYSFVNCLLGGQPDKSGSTSVPNRPCTEVEMRLIERVLQTVLPDLAGSFTRRIPLKVSRIVTEGSLLESSTRSEAVALVTFELVCGAKQGLLQLCIPWKQVAGSPGFTLAALAGGEEAMRQAAVKIPVTAVAQIARLKLATKDVANLCPGDVLLTDVSSTDDIQLEIDGCGIFRGSPGQSQNHKVIRLTDALGQSALGSDRQSG